MDENDHNIECEICKEDMGPCRVHIKFLVVRRRAGLAHPNTRARSVPETHTVKRGAIEISHVPAHPWPLNAPCGELFARALNGPRADEVAALVIRAVEHPCLILLEIVTEGRERGR
jgi:hypothetical protein